MTRKWELYALFIGIVIVNNSCNTYTTFYSHTFSSISQDQISEIHRLDLSHQNLDALPQNFSELKDLRMLDLSGNPKLNLENIFQKLSSQTDLQVLILDSIDISELPRSVEKLSNLKQLSLAYNPDLNLAHTLDLIANLPIEFLNLKGNHIQSLPENIINLKFIKDLNLSYNRLKGKTNYDLLSKLPKLYSLWLDHNQLETLPNSIGKINQMRFLYIDHNRLTKLPIEMSEMRTWVIHAGYNSFEELPDVFTKMNSLFMVYINNNSIKTIPEAYTVEKYPLGGIILDNNPISQKERKKAEKIFKGFFLLSFEQN